MLKEKQIDLKKRSHLKKVLLGGATIGAGVIGLSALTQSVGASPSIFHRDRDGTITDLKLGGGSSLWTDSGTLTYLTSLTDDWVVGSSSTEDIGVSGDARAFFDKDKGAFRAGEVNADEWNVGNRGTYSTAFGQNCKASGSGSFSAGINSDAGGANSAAFGKDHTVSGTYAFTSGDDNTVSGYSSAAFGVDNTLVADYSFICGRQNNLNGVYPNSFMGGFNNTITASTCFAFGNTNQISGSLSMAVGQGQTIASISCFAFGSSNSISTDSNYSAMFGAYNLVSDENCFVNGINTNAAGAGAVIFGTSTNPTPIGAKDHNVTGDYGLVQGKACSATGDYSSAKGLNLKTINASEHATGINWLSSTSQGDIQKSEITMTYHEEDDEFYTNKNGTGERLLITEGFTYSIEFNIMVVDTDMSVNGWQGMCTVQNTGTVITGINDIIVRKTDGTTYLGDWVNDGTPAGTGTSEFIPAQFPVEIPTVTLSFDTQTATDELIISLAFYPPGAVAHATFTINKIKLFDTGSS